MLVKGTARVTGSKAYKEDNEQVVEFTYSGNMKYTKWKINGSGWVTLEYEYNIEGDQPFTGISFNYPENYVLVKPLAGQRPEPPMEKPDGRHTE